MEHHLKSIYFFLDKSNSTETSSIRRFHLAWAKRLAQQLLASSDSTQQKELRTLIQALPIQPDVVESCLADTARRLISFEPRHFLLNESKQFLTEDGLLRWDSFKLEDTPKTTPEKFASMSMSIRNAALQCHSSLSHLSEAEFGVKFAPQLDFLPFPGVFERLFALLKQGKFWLCVTASVTWIEKALYNTLAVLLSENGGTPGELSFDMENQIKKMKDILDRNELLELVGESVATIISSFAGPLDSMNVRNMNWHGFISPAELHPSLASFSITLLLSLEPLLGEVLRRGRQLELDPGFANFDSCNLSTTGKFFIFDKEITDTPGSLAEDVPTQALLEPLRQSPFFIEGFLDVWSDAIDCIRDGQYYEGLVGLMPVVEAGLRRVFVAVNDCSAARLTAESDVLCLTLDILLAHSLQREIYLLKKQEIRRASLSPSTMTETEAEKADEASYQTGKDTKNALFDFITPQMANALFDLFIWKETGFRLRDNVAHGKVNPRAISRTLATYALSISFALCLSFHPDVVLDDFIPALPLPLKRAMNYMNNYRTCFHVKVNVCNELRDATLKLHRFCLTHPTVMTQNDELVQKVYKELYDKHPDKAQVEDAYSTNLASWMDSFVQQGTNLARAIVQVHRPPGRTCWIDGDSIPSQNFTLTNDFPFPINSPVLERTLAFLATQRKNIQLVSYIIDFLEDRWNNTKTLVETRKAFKRHRVAFVQNFELIPFFVRTLTNVLLICEEGMWHQEYPTTYTQPDSADKDLALGLFFMLGSLNSTLADNKFRRAAEIAASSMWTESASKEGTLHFSSAESKRMWLNTTAYVKRVAEAKPVPNGEL